MAILSRSKTVILIFFLALMWLASGCAGKYLNPRHQGGQVLNPKFEPKKNLRPDKPDVVTIFGLGDWGTGEPGQFKVAKLLKAELELTQGRIIKPFVLGLGDNHYPNGLSEVWGKTGPAAKQLEKSFGVYRDLSVDGQPIVFHVVHGNHDHRGDLPMWETLAECMFDENSNGAVFKSYNLWHENIDDSNDKSEYNSLKSCKTNQLELSMPELVPAGGESIRIIALDTQFLLDIYQVREWEIMAAEAINSHWEMLDDLIHDGDPPNWIIVIGHHPLRTHGKHGGSFFGNTWWGKFSRIIPSKDIQDLKHPANIAMRQDLETVLSSAKSKVIYLAGHEHNLQFLRVNENLLQVVSGSAGKTTGVQGKEDTIFCDDSLGFVRFDITPEEMWIEFPTLNSGPCSPSALFHLVRNKPFDQ